MMYLQTLFTLYDRPLLLKKHCHEHFFKPYESTNAFARGLFYPLEALFEETLPNLVICLYHIGQAIVSAVTTLAYLALAQKKEMVKENQNTVNALIIATAAILIAGFAPIAEALRFFTRWAATLQVSLSQKEESKDTLRRSATA